MTAETPVDGRTREARLAAKQQAEATPPAQRRRRAPVAGLALKLDAPTRPGFVRRFVNGDPMRIKRMEDLGYTLVSDLAGEGTTRTDGLGTRITRHAGRDDQGRPYEAVLMETPDDLYAEGIAEKEEGRKPFEEAIRRGQDTTGDVEGAYQPSARSSINHTG